MTRFITRRLTSKVLPYAVDGLYQARAAPEVVPESAFRVSVSRDSPQSKSMHVRTTAKTDSVKKKTSPPVDERETE